MQRSETIKELAIALCKAQSVMKAALKDSTNPFFKSKYADFSSVWETARKPLTDNGLSIAQSTDMVDGHIIVETMLLHESGEWIMGRLQISPIKQDPQSIGSAITYARRYSLSGLVCLATEEDDDANAANKEPEKFKTLNCEELIQKMESSANIFELKNRWKKYEKDVAALSGEDRVKVTMAKDKRKVLLQSEEKKEKNDVGE